VALPALGLPFAAACNGGRTGASHRVPASTAPRGPTTSSSGAPPEPRGPRGSGQPVRFAFGGDVHFPHERDTVDAGAISPVVLADQLRSDPTHLLDPIAPVLSGADLAMVNLETAITDRGAPVAGKQFHFRSPAESFVALKAAGVHVINMANNHALDYGPVGMEDTFAAIASSKVPVVGIGDNATEAYAPYRTEIKGQRIAIFGAVDWLEPGLVSQWTATDTQPGLAFSIDRTRLLASIRAVRPEVDTLVAFMHWGVEETHCASPEQSQLAQALLAAGADIVVGSHAHRVFGAGHVGPSLVAYGLGNFVYWREDGESGRSGVLMVEATGREVDAYSWVPARIANGVPVPATGSAAAADLADWESRRTCSGLSA
jgi:poly-gamma-glutamate synthesis protein (capsule biosynthesis protein)